MTQDIIAVIIIYNISSSMIVTQYVSIIRSSCVSMPGSHPIITGNGDATPLILGNALSPLLPKVATRL